MCVRPSPTPSPGKSTRAATAAAAMAMSPAKRHWAGVGRREGKSGRNSVANLRPMAEMAITCRDGETGKFSKRGRPKGSWWLASTALKFEAPHPAAVGLGHGDLKLPDAHGV